MPGTDLHKRSFCEVDPCDTTGMIYIFKVDVDNLYSHINEQEHVIANLRYEQAKTDKILTDMVQNKNLIIHEEVTQRTLKIENMVMVRDEARDDRRDEDMRKLIKMHDNTAKINMDEKDKIHQELSTSLTKRIKSANDKVARNKSRNKFLAHANEVKDQRIIKLENDIRTLAPLNTDTLVKTEERIVKLAADLEEMLQTNRKLRNLNGDLERRLENEPIFCHDCYELNMPVYQPFYPQFQRETPRFFRPLADEKRLDTMLDIELVDREVACDGE